MFKGGDAVPDPWIVLVSLVNEQNWYFFNNLYTGHAIRNKSYFFTNFLPNFFTNHSGIFGIRNELLLKNSSQLIRYQTVLCLFVFLRIVSIFDLDFQTNCRC